MTFDYTQGDPALILDETGADLEFVGGQPVMDQGLENAVKISMFTRNGWWGNTLFDDPNQKIGSDYEKIANQAITVSAIRRITAAAERALKWMVDTGLALSAIAEVVNRRVGWLDTAVLITPPSKDQTVLVASKHGSNWIAQRDYPAYKRLSR